MTPSPLSQSRKITQEIEDQKPFEGWLWLVVVHQWVGVSSWCLVFVGALHGESVLSLWTVAVILSFWLSNTWLMHKRRALFVWMFLVQTFFEFGIWVLAAERDSEIYGAAIGSLIFAAYIVLSERSRKTFTRTMEEPTC